MNIRKIIREEIKDNLSNIQNQSILPYLKPGRNSIMMPDTLIGKHEFLKKLEKDGFRSPEYPTREYPTKIRYTNWFNKENRAHWLGRLNILHLDYTPGGGFFKRLVIGYDSDKSIGELINTYKDAGKRDMANNIWFKYKDDIMNANWINWDGSSLTDYFDDFGWMIDRGHFLDESNDFDWIKDSGKQGDVAVGDKFIIYPSKAKLGNSAWDDDEYMIVQITELSDAVHFVVTEYVRNIGDRKGEQSKLDWDSFKDVIERRYWTPIS
jgi:hypothetical protein